MFGLKCDENCNDANEESELEENGEDVEMDDEDKVIDRQERRRYKPYKFSGKSYTFDMNHEKAIIDDLREWALNYFAKEYVITKDMYKLLKDLKGG